MNGTSEQTQQWSDIPRSESPMPEASGSGSRLEGGSTGMMDLGEDEEMDGNGWVKKKIHRLKKSASSLSGGIGGEDGSTSSKKKKIKLGNEVDVGKGLGYFRVNLSTLG